MRLTLTAAENLASSLPWAGSYTFRILELRQLGGEASTCLHALRVGESALCLQKTIIIPID